MNLSAEAITGIWSNSGFRYNSGEKIDLTSFIDHSGFTASNITYAHPKVVAASKTISWNEQGNRSFHLKEISVLPTQTWEEWLAESNWQADYLTLKGESLEIARWTESETGRLTDQYRENCCNRYGTHHAEGQTKTIPARIDKGMPTELVERIPFPVKVDTIQIVNSAVLVNQISEKTSKKGTIPIRDLNALVTGISNQNKFNELSITASGAIFDNYIRSLQYRENYQDGAGFTFTTEISPMVLPSFNPISIPLANIAVKTGNAEVLYMQAGKEINWLQLAKWIFITAN